MRSADTSKRDLARLENFQNELHNIALRPKDVKVSDILFLQFEATLLVANLLLEVREELRTRRPE